MDKTIVIYYSNTGNNRFLANRIAKRLDCDIEEIKPVINSKPLLLLGTTLGIKKIRADLSQYEKVILVGPVMVGKFLAPLKAFVSKYKEKIKGLIFVTCCGSSYEIKDQKFGHGLVFNKVREILGDKYLQCAALPITLVIPPDKKDDPQLVMGTRLNDDNFKGEISERFEEFINSIS